MTFQLSKKLELQHLMSPKEAESLCFLKRYTIKHALVFILDDYLKYFKANKNYKFFLLDFMYFYDNIICHVRNLYNRYALNKRITHNVIKEYELDFSGRLIPSGGKLHLKLVVPNMYFLNNEFKLLLWNYIDQLDFKNIILNFSHNDFVEHDIKYLYNILSMPQIKNNKQLILKLSNNRFTKNKLMPWIVYLLEIPYIKYICLCESDCCSCECKDMLSKNIIDLKFTQYCWKEFFNEETREHVKYIQSKMNKLYT